MIKILVVGGYDKQSEKDWKDVHALASELGRQIIKQGHELLSGCRTEFDCDVAKGAHEELQQTDPTNVDTRLKSYVPKGAKEAFDFGTLLKSELINWDPANGIQKFPEPIEEADVVIFVRGFEGLNRAAIWADLARKPMLPVATFEGAAARLFHRELSQFEEKYAGRIEKDDFQVLNMVAGDLPKLAEKVVSLAERVLVSNVVPVMMSYTLDETKCKNLTNSYEVACDKYGYKCEPVTELSAEEGIVAEIHKKIRQAAFVLADFTELKPNVFYEFGFSQGLGKRRIVTAQEGTILPFDVNDVPTLFWTDDWADLQKRIVEKIKPIAESHGR